MRHKPIVLSALLPIAFFAGVGPTPFEDDVSRLAWMAGCWELRSGNRIVEEQWMAPLAGVMLGMSRTTEDGQAAGHEYLMIFEDPRGIVLRAMPSGQAQTDFVASDISASSVLFENPEHDFPQRVAYRSAADGDSLIAAVGAGDGAEARDISFPYGRVACAG
jgi:hypothetical protein